MRGVSVGIVLIGGLGTAVADELPRAGKVRLEIAQVQFASRDLHLDHDTGAGGIEFGGVTRNVDGQPWFDRMTQRCTGQYYQAENNPPAANGACLLSDLLGDRMIVAYRATAPRAGVQRIIGGTGRYKGITGQGTYTTVKLRPPTVGVEFWLTELELEYELDRSLQ
jgi:hypothetical protein